MDILEGRGHWVEEWENRVLRGWEKNVERGWKDSNDNFQIFLEGGPWFTPFLPETEWKQFLSLQNWEETG